MADPNLAQNPINLTGRDDYIVCLALAYALVLNTSLQRTRNQPRSSDCRDFRALLRIYPDWMVAAALRQTFATITGSPISEQRLARDLAALRPDDAEILDFLRAHDLVDEGASS